MATQDEPTSTTEGTTQGDAPTLDVGGTEEAPAKAPRRRRATKKAAAPTTAVPEAADPSAGADAPADSPTEDSSADDAPAAKAPKKRAAKKSAEKPAKKAAKRASRAKKTAAVEPEAEAPVGQDELVALEEDESTEGEQAQVADVAEASADEDASEQAPAPVVPSFGLLFQAPDISAAPRRRRATAPAQAPAERPATTGPAKGADDRDSSDADESGSTEPSETSDESGDEPQDGNRRRRRGGRGRRGRGGNDKAEQPATETAEAEEAEGDGDGDKDAPDDTADAADGGEGTSSRRRRRRRRSGSSSEGDDPPGTVTKVREPRKERDEPTAVKGSTRLEAKKQRRREGREAGRRRTIITEAEFLARRESVERVMAVRGKGDKTQIGVLEDGVLVEHYVSRETNASMAGNVYLGRVQNVLPSMEAAFVDIGKGRNAVLYAGEVNWDAAGLEQNQAKRIENALGSGDTVLVQVTKDPIGHKGARLTSQISLPGRYLVYVPEGSMTGISRKLPDTERARLKAILKEVVPDSAGVIVRTAAEGASEEELRADVERLTKAWEGIKKKAESAKAKKASSGGAPVLLHGEADLTVRVIRDVFTEDFSSLVVSGDKAWSEVSGYVEDVAPDLAKRLTHWTSEQDLFAHYRVDEQIAKAMDRKVWLPSGGSLVIDRTEAMTVVDVNTGKFVGSGGNLEETVTKNNIEAAEEIVRQLRLRDIGGIIVIDFIDMVLESNRDLVVRRLLECLGRDRTKHQVAEVTSLGLVQMTRKRVGSGLIEVFSEQCEHCDGRGIIVQAEPIDRSGSNGDHGPSHGNGGQGGSGGGSTSGSGRGRGRRGKGGDSGQSASKEQSQQEAPTPSGPTAAQIAAAAHAAAIKSMSGEPTDDDVADLAPAPASEPEQAEAVEATQPEQTEAPSEVPTDAKTEVPADTKAEDPADASPVVIAEVGDAVEAESISVAEPAPIDEPVVRPRRKRGRVVAPAGPPKSADLDQPEGDR
ncbi:ribonuclease E [Knoellia sinensis KCTC 19936]|uniref:Ribonuclease E n=1 Tax=Knoellia sinensis KCTC 19936 TaxID=1385520 RepID=A0A0A0IXQ4_9MICO|nr:Rne/Rng family ribonuclease [Knoellia sinensis]KGN29970.1 ribonuclease E [Knoellia sinensis KCTC 19936]